MRWKDRVLTDYEVREVEEALLELPVKKTLLGEVSRICCGTRVGIREGCDSVEIAKFW